MALLRSEGQRLLGVFGSPNTTVDEVQPFTDDFNREDEALEDSADWTRVDGTAGAAVVSSNQVVGVGAAAYQCPDQGSVDHYTQAVNKVPGGSNTSSFQVCVRLTNGSNYIGARANGTGYQMYKNVGGSFTQLAADTSIAHASGDVMRLEAEGDSITLKINGEVRLGPVTESFNNTQTRQGYVARSDVTAQFDDFEAGVL